MRIVEEFRKQFSDLAPILILAPTTRCGSTLLQRAINQRGQAIIYGENFVFLEQLPFLVNGAAEHFEGKVRAAAATLEEFLRGNKGMDASALFPDYEAYRRLLWGFFYQVAQFYRDQARSHGYSRWGLKHQITALAGFHHFLQIIPGYRSVTVFRDLIAVAKSMNTRWPENLQTEAQCFEIGRNWQNNLKYLLRLDRRRNLVLRYEDLATHKERWLALVEKHLELEVSREAFDKRVNAHSYDLVTGRVSESYSPPTDLPESKIEALLKGAQPLYGQLGYRYPQATPLRETPSLGR